MDNKKPTVKSTLSTLAIIAVSVFSISFVIYFFTRLFERRFSEEDLANRPEVTVIAGGTRIANRTIFAVRVETQSPNGITTSGGYLWTTMILNKDGSPFHTSMPQEFGVDWVPRIEKDQYRGLALLQDLPTAYAWSRDARKSKSTGIWASADNKIYFDNATDEDVNVLVDYTSMPLLPSRSHGQVTVNVGIHQIEIRSQNDSKTRDTKSVLIEKKNTYIYNVAGRNSYSVGSAIYRTRNR